MPFYLFLACVLYFVIVPFLSLFFFCSRWSFVDVPLTSLCPVDHVSDWQPRILLGMVKARTVNVKKTTTTTTRVGGKNPLGGVRDVRYVCGPFRGPYVRPLLSPTTRGTVQCSTVHYSTVQQYSTVQYVWSSLQQYSTVQNS